MSFNLAANDRDGIHSYTVREGVSGDEFNFRDKVRKLEVLTRCKRMPKFSSIRDKSSSSSSASSETIVESSNQLKTHFHKRRVQKFFNDNLK